MRFRGNQSLYDRLVVEGWTQSNGCGGSEDAIQLPGTAAGNQMGAIWARHSRYNGGSDFEIDTVWGPVNCPNGPPNSLLNPGIPTHGIVQPIARRLQDELYGVAILQCGYGSTDSAYWETNYADPYALWCAARYAQLTNPTTIAMYIWQGESDVIGGTVAAWRARWEAIIAARRVAVGVATLPVFVVRLSNTCPLDATNLAAMQAAAEALVAADPYAHLIVDNAMTFFGGPDADSATLQRVALAIANGILAL
jgi:hypothetical protein